MNETDTSYVARLLDEHRRTIAKTLDEQRADAVAKRNARGNRTARENLEDLCDAGSFTEYGQLAVAAQRQRREIEDLRENTAADGVITGTATINADEVGAAAASAAVIINDYTVLAGTQGFYHHRKIDRMIEVASKQALPVVMFAEGGGGRPGDTDVTTVNASLDIATFARWAGLAGRVPRIAVTNGFCFAGNAALYGCADIRIATRNSWIGMAGPAMIEGGGLGRFEPTDIGPVDMHLAKGVVDLCADDEADATLLARKVLGYFQGATTPAGCADQALLRDILPDDRRFSYKMRELIDMLADADSFTELTAAFGGSIIAGCMRIEGVPLAVLANDCRVLGGAIDADAAQKATRFMKLCKAFDLPLVTLVDTPGFMVGPDSEAQAAVLHTSDMFVAGAAISAPVVSIVVRKAYGLGAQAMACGSFKEPLLAVSWPTGEFGPMGLEGAVKLGFRKELEAESDDASRKELFERLVAELYEKGKAAEVATVLEMDAVIDPADTRDVICRALGIRRPDGAT